MRTCKRCEQDKQYPDEYPPQGRTCRACKVDIVREWRQKNPERLAQQRANHRASRSDHRAEYAKRWRAENRDRYNERRREWRKLNPDKVLAEGRRRREHRYGGVLALNHARRAREMGAVGKHSARDYERLLRRHGGMCAYCRTKKATTRDHVVPLSRGGTNFIGNILPACRSCNSSKNNRLLVEWWGWQN